jgi:hypothetical protein
VSTYCTAIASSSTIISGRARAQLDDRLQVHSRLFENCPQILEDLTHLRFEVALTHELPVGSDRSLAGDERDRPGTVDAPRLRETSHVLPCPRIDLESVHDSGLPGAKRARNVGRARAFSPVAVPMHDSPLAVLAAIDLRHTKDVLPPLSVDCCEGHVPGHLGGANLVDVGCAA